MPDVTDQPLLVTLWRRKWIVVGAVLLAGIVAGAFSKTLDKVYETSSKLLIVQVRDSTSFDAIQAAQVTARTYSDVLSSPNIAALVARQLGDGTTRADIESNVSIQPISETQLLEIKAEANDPARAKALADTYARVFIDYARTALAPTTSAKVTLADSAPLVAVPARPKPTLYVLLACLLALPLGIALALLRDRLDSRLRSPEQIDERFGLPTLGRVPRRGRSAASHSVFDEAFRLLRTSLRFISPGDSARVIAVTSGSEGEGKTTTSYNLARAAHETDQRVLLVEADVYRGRLLELLDLGHLRASSTLGLTSYLAGVCDLDEAIIHADSGLSVLPAGPLPPSMSALLEAGRGQTLISALGERAELVILDCPPLAPRADATQLAARADGVVLVVDLASTTTRRLENSLRQLGAVSANLLGIVINRDSTMKTSEYSYYSDSGQLPETPAASPPTAAPR